MGEHTQTGVAAAFSVDEYDNDLIRKHERTRPDKENDRTRHILTLRAQTGPVFLTYRADRRIDALVEAETKAEPLYDFEAPDGVRHTVWRATARRTARALLRRSPAALHRRRPPPRRQRLARARGAAGDRTRTTRAKRSTTASSPSSSPTSRCRFSPTTAS